MVRYSGGRAPGIDLSPAEVKALHDQLAAAKRELERKRAQVERLTHGAGPMEQAVVAELQALFPGRAGGGSLAVGAVILARALDQYARHTETAAQLSAIVKTHAELRMVLGQVRKAAEEARASDAAGVDAASLSAPVRDAALE
jgi:hypothetical protein